MKAVTKKDNFYLRIYSSNIIISLIGCAIGIFFPKSLFETAVITLLIIFWADLLVVILELRNLKLCYKNQTDVILDRLHDTLKSFALDASTITKIKNKSATEKMKQMIILHNKVADKTGFNKPNDIRIQFFISHYMENYIQALDEICYKKTLNLTSFPRMEASIKAIESARLEILAVSADNDLWLGAVNKQQYLDINLKKAQRNLNKIKSGQFTFKRLYLIKNCGDLKILKPIFDKQINLNIDIRYAVREQIESELGNEKGMIPIANILICDGKFLSHSTNLNTHNGKLVVDKNEIDKYRIAFLKLWSKSKKYESNADPD